MVTIPRQSRGHSFMSPLEGAVGLLRSPGLRATRRSTSGGWPRDANGPGPAALYRPHAAAIDRASRSFLLSTRGDQLAFGNSQTPGNVKTPTASPAEPGLPWPLGFHDAECDALVQESDGSRNRSVAFVNHIG